MTYQPCFSPQRLKTGNPNLAGPCERYRHGSDPPDYQRPGQACDFTYRSGRDSCQTYQASSFDSSFQRFLKIMFSNFSFSTTLLGEKF